MLDEGIVNKLPVSEQVSFYLKHGKSWKASLETCKFMDVFTETSTRVILSLFSEKCLALSFEYLATDFSQNLKR